MEYLVLNENLVSYEEESPIDCGSKGCASFRDEKCYGNSTDE